jgi:hypothetical protein
MKSILARDIKQGNFIICNSNTETDGSSLYGLWIENQNRWHTPPTLSKKAARNIQNSNNRRYYKYGRALYDRNNNYIENYLLSVKQDKNNIMRGIVSEVEEAEDETIYLTGSFTNLDDKQCAYIRLKSSTKVIIL